MKNTQSKWRAALAAVVVAAGAAVAFGAQRYQVTPLESPRAVGPSSTCGEAIPGPRRKPGSMRIETSSAGVIPGPGPNDTIPFFEVSHSVRQPVDSRSGLPTGLPERGDVIVTKSVNESTPELMRALITNELILEVVFDFFDSSGANDYRLTLRDGRITQLDTRVVKRCDGTFAHLEEVAFWWDELAYEHLPTGRRFTDQRPQSQPSDF